MIKKFTALHAIFLLLFLANLAHAADFGCIFDPATYNALTYEDQNLTVSASYGEGNFELWTYCGQGLTPVKTTLQNHEGYASNKLNFTCNFNVIGQATSKAEIHGGDLIESCIAQINVSAFQIGLNLSTSYVEMGTGLNGSISVANPQPQTIENVQLGIKHRLGNSDSQFFTSSFPIGGYGEKQENFTLESANMPEGNYIMVANASLGKHYVLAYKEFAIIPSIQLVEIFNSTTNSTVSLNWTTNTPANYSLTFWENNTNYNYSFYETNFSQRQGFFRPDLKNNTRYSYSLTICSRAQKCTGRQGDLKTQKNSDSTATSTPTATATATASATPTIIATPSPTISATIIPTGVPGRGDENDPSPSPSPSKSAPSPTKQFDIYKIDTQISPDIDDLSQAAKDIVTSGDIAIVTNISIISIRFDPPITRLNSLIKIIGNTDSNTTLKEIKCAAYTNESISADCTCVVNYGGPTWFKCEIDARFGKPALSPAYRLEIFNSGGQVGIYTANLPIGQSASIVRRELTYVRRNEFYFYAGIFITMMLVAYGLFHLFSKLEKESKEGEVLLEQKKRVLDDIETLKFHYMKRDIDVITYNKAMTVKEKELTEVNTRIAERESKISKAKLTEGTKNKPNANNPNPDGLPAKVDEAKSDNGKIPNDGSKSEKSPSEKTAEIKQSMEKESIQKNNSQKIEENPK